jgi:hypothetical protein
MKTKTSRWLLLGAAACVCVAGALLLGFLLRPKEKKHVNIWKQPQVEDVPELVEILETSDE